MNIIAKKTMRMIRKVDKWWIRADEGNFLPRWLLLGVYVVLMWWQVGMLNQISIGSYTLNSLAIIGFIALVVLPRKYWHWVLVILFLLIYWHILPRSFGIVHKDHIAYLEGPLHSISNGGPFYKQGISENPYMPWSALIFWPFWHFGWHDMRYLLVAMAAAAGFILFLAKKNRPEGLLLIMVFLFNGFTLESNLYMYLATSSMCFFLFLGLYILKKNPLSITGIIAVCLATLIKQQAVLLIPFIFLYWLYRRNLKQIIILLSFFLLLLLPFILPDWHDFVNQTVKAHADVIPYFYYNQLGNFYQFSPLSLQNLAVLIPNGVHAAWKYRLIPLNIVILILGLGMFAIRKRTWDQAIKAYVIISVLFFASTISINIATYYFILLFLYAFTGDMEKRGVVK